MEIRLEKLTRKELLILKEVARHHTSKEIAEMMGLAVKTIENRRCTIAAKLKLPKENASLLKFALIHRKTILDYEN